MTEGGSKTGGQLATAADLRSLGIVDAMGVKVVLDADLAAIFGVETRVLNQAVKRNQERFPTAWAFELTQGEFDDLRSRDVISSVGWGGRRTPPWMFSEHGVVMAASVLSSDRAIAVMQLVVDVFVRTRRAEHGGGALSPKRIEASLSRSGGAFGRRLQGMIERLMDAMVDQESQRTLRDEAQGVLKESIEHIRAKLGRANFENEEIAARAAKLLTEAEATRATAVKTRAEADEIALRTLAKKLTMLLEAEQAMARGEAKGFLRVLRKLGKA
jgi:hypothetical protein